MDKPKETPMCLSHEEQDSMRALAGTAEETVELTQSLYRLVVSQSNPNMTALKLPPSPTFDEEVRSEKA